MRVGSRRQLSSTLGWALCLAALVVDAALATTFMDETPQRVLLALGMCAVVAGSCGAYLSWRLATAHSRALRDPLTGLPNRVLLDDRLEQALRSSHRTGEPFTLIVVDLDGFKDVNDLRGHGAGDAVLRTLARRFETIMRASDTVARVGGDEFVVLSIGTSYQDSVALVSRLRHALRRPFRVNGATVELDGSIGWAIFPNDGITGEELLSYADGQMYATKRGLEDDPSIVRRGVDAGVVRDMETALEQKELVVVYQPIIDLASGAPHSAEALVRRVLPDGSLVAPAEFLPHVERTPLARELTFLVLADALRSAAHWSEAGHELGVSVNVPHRLLDDRAFVDGVTQLVRSSDVAPRRLTLEVAPSGSEVGVSLDESILARLTALGVRLSLDDGGRPGSFAALRGLPLDELKIDSTLVRGLGQDATDAAVVHGLIGIGHDLGLGVVAEGVETREAWRFLVRLGCDYAQGFFVAGPLPPEELVTWLEGSWPAVA